VLFSNTSLAHRSGKTHDWVVIYYERGGEQRQSTIVTAERGKLSGKRVVRGRERECKEYCNL
jgi:DNA polymerase (family 10)